MIKKNKSAQKADLPMSKELIAKINKLKKQKQAVILVHNYQLPEIYEVADFIGDSLGLARAAKKTKAKIIVFCGVDFMAESAKILNPTKKVLLPALAAKCPMAAMVNISKLKKWQKKYPKAKTVCYVNTTAVTKANCDVCCTSANAVKVARSLKAKQIIFLPDKNLASYVQSQLPNKEIIAWPGFCYVHAKILVKQVKLAKARYKKAKVIVHPECPLEVINHADHVTSTTGMLKYAKKSKAKEFIIVTEMGMVHRLSKEIKNKKFYAVGGMCVQMKKNSLQKVLEVLEKENNEVIVLDKIRSKAKKSLDNMLKIN